MEFNFETLNWAAIGICIVVGQLFLTAWFTVLFGTPWAKAYGVKTKEEHTKEVPAYTYGIGLICTVLLTLGIALLQSNLAIHSLGDGLFLGIMLAIFFCISTALPGYAFLKRWNAFALAIGSQTLLIIMISIILAIWK